MIANVRTGRCRTRSTQGESSGNCTKGKKAVMCLCVLNSSCICFKLMDRRMGSKLLRQDRLSLSDSQKFTVLSLTGARAGRIGFLWYGGADADGEGTGREL